MGHIRHLSTQKVLPLQEEWSVYLAEPGTIIHPAELTDSHRKPIVGEAPGTVVSAFRKAKSKTLDHRSPDDYDVWYTSRFSGEIPQGSDRARLVFDGLATFADIWLNGEHLLHSENMFLRHEVDITTSIRPGNELSIRFSSLNRFLEQRRPRPQWRTNLVDHSQLRWARTALAGRMPGWHQNASESHTVGPWRPVSLVVDHLVQVVSSDIRTTMEKTEGVVRACLDIRLLEGKLTEAALTVGEHQASLQITENNEGGFTLVSELRLPDPALWWPHTHGEQRLYPISAQLSIDGKIIEIDLGRTGFRSLSFDTREGGFAVTINGEQIFLRGANWNTLDASGLLADDAKCDHLLTLARDAGMNMLRVSGTGSYETDFFYDRCAELGITLWHDFAFAVMDYPGEDEAFRESVSTEADQILQRLQQNPALTVLCGNSECEMGAAMHGLSSEKWQNPLFHNVLAEAVADVIPEVAFIPSSPYGGALPFQPDTGASHYYGVGAYLKPREDVRRSNVRFAAECLGFSNIPEDDTIDAYLAPGECPGRQPSWKAGVPRNVSLGWDFDDVRDHYVRTLFGEEPNAALYSDIERYLTLGRIVNGELMTGAFSEWRRPASSCKGALVWYFQDIWPGAGWGIIDSFGRPKSVYFYLKRILSPVSLFFSDEGLNGLRLHVINERPAPLKANVRIALYRSGHTCLHQQTVPIELTPHSATELNVDALLGYFADTTFAYRFGPPTQNVTVATLEMEDTLDHPRAFFFPTGLRFPQTADIGLQAQAQRHSDGRYDLTLRTERFAQAVKIDARGCSTSDNYFHLEPGQAHTVALTPHPGYQKPLVGYVTAANAQVQTSITLLPTESHTEASTA
jgi:beta-mannosidase